MGPVIRVPADVARRLIEETDLVEAAHLLLDTVDELDVELGDTTGEVMLLTETPKDGYGRLVSFVVEYASGSPIPFELTVCDKQGDMHEFSAGVVNEESIHDHLKLAYFGELGDRRPLIRG